MATLVLVDGSSYLYRAFHALPDLRTSKGEPTGALRGVLSMLRRLVIDDKPDYFAVVFDAPGKTFRDDWYPEYKANRQAMPDDLILQIAPLHEAVRANGWPLLMVEGVEADDVIGTLARQAKAAGIDTLISTSDKDLAQLVEPGVTLMNTMTNERLDEEGVIAKFGVRPGQVIDLLALTGDTVDNVPGVPKVGPKTAAKWLAQYGTLDNLIAHADEISGVVGENLRGSLDLVAGGQAAPHGQARLRTAVERRRPHAGGAGYPSSCARCTTASNSRPGCAISGARRTTIPMSEASSRPVRRATMRDVAGTQASRRPRPPCPRSRRTTKPYSRERRWIAGSKRSPPPPSCRSTRRRRAPIRCGPRSSAYRCRSNRATRCYIPFGHRYAGVPAQLPAADVLGGARAVVCGCVEGEAWPESQVRPARARQPLDHVARRPRTTRCSNRTCSNRTGRTIWRVSRGAISTCQTISYDAVTGKGAHRIPFEQVALDRATEYSAEDADVTLRLHQQLFPQIERDPKLSYIYQSIELPVREVLFRMERTGVLIDSDVLAAQSRDLGQRAQALEHEAHRLAGTPFNLGSPRQLCEILYERMKIPVRKKTATGQPSTDEDVLQELAADYPLPKVLLDYRAVAKLKSTYTDKLPAMVNSSTGRLHTTFSQATAVTGRLASTDPNLQNIPVRTTDGRRIREAFIAPAGHALISADYSQVELRIMAHLSEDPALLRAFLEGADIHRATAAEIFGVALDEVSTDQRRYIKAVNFGLIYGMGAFGLATQLNIERAAAQQFIERYFARYPGVAAYMQRTRELAREQGYVETVFGRRLFLPDIRAAGGPRRAGAERAAINAPMQGTAADLIKLAMIAVQDYLDRERLATRLILQVHDELVLEAPDGELARILRDLPQLMTSVATLRAPLVVDIGHGPNWEQAH